MNYVVNGSNSIAGATPLIKAGGGTVTIANANSFTGGVQLNGGVIRVGNTLAFGTTNGLTFGPNVAAGTKLQLNGNNITLTGLTSDPNPGSPVVENDASVDATLTLDLETAGGTASGNAHSVFAGVLQDGGSGKLGLTLTGNGSLTLAGANTYTGGTKILGGTLKIGANNALPTSSTVTINSADGTSAGTLDLNGFNAAIGALTIVAPANPATVVIGTGTLTLHGDVSVIDAAGAPGNNAPVTIAVGVLDLGGTTRTFNIAGQRNIGDLVVNSVVQNGSVTINATNSTSGVPNPGVVEFTAAPTLMADSRPCKAVFWS